MSSNNKRRHAYAQHQRFQKQQQAAASHKWPLFLRSDSADATAAVSWKLLAELRSLPKNTVRLSLFLRAVSQLVANDMVSAVERMTSQRALTQAERTLGDTIVRVSELIENTRLTRRSALLEQIPLTDERYSGECFNMAIALWLLGCQCNLLVNYLSEAKPSEKTGADFAVAMHVRELVMYRSVRIMDYSLSALRMVILRIVKLWTRLPILDDDFIEYLRLVRLRTSELQCMAYERSTNTLDYPAWTKAAGTAAGKQYDRASLDMARQCELYLYHLSRHIENERAFEQVAKPLPSEWCDAQDREHLHRWLLSRVGDVFLDQWRREVVERTMLVEILPPEREVFRQSNPGANYDTKNVLKYMRSARHDQINELLLAPAEQLVEREPVVAVIYELLFLLQADAMSFALDRYIFWVTDLPVEPDGCAYPSPTFFTNFDYPVIYCPLALSRFWVISDGSVIRCGTDIVITLALWLRIVLGLTNQRVAYESLLELRFSTLRRCLLRDGYAAPIRRRHANTAPIGGGASLAQPIPAPDASLSDLLKMILEAQRPGAAHAEAVKAAATSSGPPVISEDPAPTPSMMEF